MNNAAIVRYLLGRLKKNGVRAVRITKITRISVATDSTNHPVWKKEFFCVEKIYHNPKCQEIKKRTYGPKKEHIIFEKRDIPVSRLEERLGVDIIRWDGYLRNVIQAIG